MIYTNLHPMNYMNMKAATALIMHYGSTFSQCQKVVQCQRDDDGFRFESGSFLRFFTSPLSVYTKKKTELN